MQLYRTYAEALADVASHADGAFVDALADETRDGDHTRYEVVSAALVFALNLDQLKADLANPAKGTGIVYHRQPGLSAPLPRAAADKLGDSKSLRDVVDSGLSDATAAINQAVLDGITNGFGLDLTDGGTYNVSNVVLNNHTLASPAAGDYQREHIRAFRGRGGLYSATLFAALDGTTGYVVRGRNGAGVVAGGFRVDARGICNGVDLSWVGAGQSSGSAPSNRNRVSDIWVSNFLDVGVNLDQCHDTDISSINTTSGSGLDPIALSLQGPGGFIALRDSTLYGGRVAMSCQNGSLTNVVLSGLELTGGSYNHIAIRSCHFIDLAARGYAVQSSAVGNATRALSVDGCAFMTAGMTTGYIQGRFWQGGYIRNSLFLGGVLTSSITPAAGSGQLPVFVFEECSFNSEISYDSTNAIHVFINCRNSSGVRFSSASAALPPGHPLTYLLVNQTTKLATEVATLMGTGWVRIGSNGSGLLPANSQGVSFTWNRSGAQGEAAFAVHGGAGSAPGFHFGNVTSGAWESLFRILPGSITPGADNVQSNGTGSLRFTQVFAANGSVSTCDARLKTEPRDISAAEVTAFRAIARLPMVWKWLAKPAGDARDHAGPTVQAAISIMDANGLNWPDYAAFCYDSWEAQPAKYATIPASYMTVPATYDADGNEMTPARIDQVEPERTVLTQAAIEAGDRYSFRKDELTWWCMRAETVWSDQLHERVATLDARLAALEASSAG